MEEWMYKCTNFLPQLHMRLSDPFHETATIHGGNSPRCPWDRLVEGSRKDLDAVKIKTILPLLGIESRPSNS
jgi:hypothetical protein